MLARGWFVQDTTGSPFLVSMTMAAMMLPMLILSLPGGIVADRLDRARVVAAGEAVTLAAFIAVAALVIAGVAQPWHILVASGVNGVAFALSLPARHSIIASLVPKSQLPAATGLAHTVWSSAQIVGPAIAGVIIAGVGIEAAFILGAALILPSLGLFATLRDRRPVFKRAHGAATQELTAGIAVIRSDPGLRWLLLSSLVVSLAIMPWQSIAPVFVDDVLGGGPAALGTIVLAAGIGSLLASIAVVSIGPRFSYEKVAIASGLAAAAAIAGFALSPFLPLSMLFAGLAGLAGTAFMVTNMTVLQISVTDEIRGRVMSIRFLVVGLVPVGMMALGGLAEIAGPRIALTAFAIAGAVGFALIQRVGRSAPNNP